VAVIGEGADRVARLLAETAASVAGPMSFSADAPEESRFSNLPQDGFDIVVLAVATGAPGDAEGSVTEAKKALKPDGVLVVSATEGVASDQTGARDEKAPVFGQLLSGLFREVRLYRLGVVAGAAIFDGDVDGDAPASRTVVEDAGVFRAPPTDGASLSGGSVVAVCGDKGLPAVGDGPFLALDPDGRVFEEAEELWEELDLLRGEIRRMQGSEAQAFQDTLALRTSEVNHFRTRLERSEERLKAVTDENGDLKRRLNKIESLLAWRLLRLLRRLAVRARRGRA
jgi:SAM-dependent methyltransferase